jgi:hypothetical protein
MTMPPRLRWAVTLGLIGLVAAACMPLAFHGMFSGLRDYDDEGYLLISLRGYARGDALYDVVYSQYGPAYYQLVTALFGLLGLDFTHTAGRAIVMGVWLAIAALCAVATYRLTGNLAVTVVGQLLVFQTLLPMRNEPPHPGGLIALLVAGVVVMGSWIGVARSGIAGGVIGALLAIATLMKINVGLLGLVSTALAFLCATRGAGPWRGLRLVAAAVFVLVPAALMAPLAGTPPVAAFLVLVTGSALAVAVVLLATTAGASQGADARVECLSLGSAFVTAAGASIGWELVRGTSAMGFIDGFVLAPARQLEAIALLLPVTAPAAAGALAGSGAALAWVAAGRTGRMHGPVITGIEGVAQLAAGAFVWLVADERLPVDPLAPLPLLWLALLPRPAAPGPGVVAGRRLLVALAVLQALHAFPVAGSQVGWATFLFVPVAAILLTDGWRRAVLAVAPAAGPLARWAHPVGAVLALAMIALAAGTVRTTGQRLEAAYAAGVPLGLPGTEGIHVRAGQARLYRVLATNLAARCRTFVTMPGLNSLHLFSGVDPPSARNTTLWVALLSAAQQADVAERLARVDAPVCAVRRPDAYFDGQDTPLTRYIRREFVTLFTVGEYAFMIRRDPAPAAPRQG